MSDSWDLMMNEIKDHLSGIVDIFKKDDFLNSCIDKLKEQTLEIVFNEDESLEVVGKKQSANAHGIYMFWADFSSLKKDSAKSSHDLFNEFSVDWDDWEQSKKYDKFPKANKTRRGKLLTNNAQVDITAIPFYLGRSEKLKERIEEHYNFSGSESTYALKLNHRYKLLKGIKFKVAWLPLNVDKDTYFIVDKIESLLRDKLNPIIGKQ